MIINGLEINRNTEFLLSLKESVNAGRSISIIIDEASKEVQNCVKQIIDEILDHHLNSDLATTVYTCTKELIINGMKANAKRVFFESLKFDLHNEADYQKGMNEFRKVVQLGGLDPYLVLAREKGLIVEVDFKHSSDRLEVNVKNNVELTKAEHHRIKQKMASAVKYDDIAQFYMDSVGESQEGAGMGITMIILMLKGHNVSVDNFQIMPEQTRSTLARLEFPLS